MKVNSLATLAYFFGFVAAIVSSQDAEPGAIQMGSKNNLRSSAHANLEEEEEGAGRALGLRDRDHLITYSMVATDSNGKSACAETKRRYQVGHPDKTMVNYGQYISKKARWGKEWKGYKNVWNDSASEQKSCADAGYTTKVYCGPKGEVGRTCLYE